MILGARAGLSMVTAGKDFRFGLLSLSCRERIINGDHSPFTGQTVRELNDLLSLALNRLPASTSLILAA